MTEPAEASLDEDSRLFPAVQQYLQEIEAGRSPDRSAFLRRHAHLGDRLEPYLEAVEMLRGAAPQLKQTSDSPRSGAPEMSPAQLSGEPLGDFQLIREIGRGGMGVVYEATQLSLGRRVAIKVLPFAAALDSRQLQRFRNEAQAAAALHHPHVVPVYGVGCERGVHFYVMQLIRGQNLSNLIDGLKDEAPTNITGDESAGPSASVLPLVDDRRRPAIETRNPFGAELTTCRLRHQPTYYRTIARMIAEAADGLEYAHSLGIIHRDVKPANILVDDSGTVWVADFGLAQIQTEHALTQTGDLLGTLRYMSPEQATGQTAKVDHRTDVYSLGASLYELLALKPLFSASNRGQLLHQILQEEPRSPRAGDRSIPRELELITLKALQKSPAERYASVREMRDDLQRFLNDLPIQARPPSLIERLTKWSRRHRGVVISGVAALLLTVAGLSVAMWITAAAYDRERVKATEAAMQYERAEENFRQARAAVDEFTRIGEESAGDRPQSDSTRIRILEAALAYYQNFVEQHREDPQLQAELAASVARMEAILGQLNTLAGAQRYILLLDPAVQDDLKLTESQIALIGKHHRRWRDLMRSQEQFSKTEREQQRLEIARSQDAEVQQTLTAVQQHRFQQIVRQSAGPRALQDDALARQLHLSDGQQIAIRQLLNDYLMDPDHGPGPGPGPGRGPGPGPHFGPPPGPGLDFPPPHFFDDGPREFPLPHEESGAARAKAQAIVVDELSRILTDAQKHRWQELLGEPLRSRSQAWKTLQHLFQQKDKVDVVPE